MKMQHIVIGIAIIISSMFAFFGILAILSPETIESFLSQKHQKKILQLSLQ